MGLALPFLFFVSHYYTEYISHITRRAHKKPAYVEHVLRLRGMHFEVCFVAYHCVRFCCCCWNANKLLLSLIRAYVPPNWTAYNGLADLFAAHILYVLLLSPNHLLGGTFYFRTNRYHLILPLFLSLLHLLSRVYFFRVSSVLYSFNYTVSRPQHAFLSILANVIAELRVPKPFLPINQIHKLDRYRYAPFEDKQIESSAPTLEFLVGCRWLNVLLIWRNGLVAGRE